MEQNYRFSPGIARVDRVTSEVSRESLYATLGVDETTSKKGVRSAFRALVRKYHPDFNPGDSIAESNYRAVVDAYATLTKPEDKARYDKGTYQSTSPAQGDLEPSNILMFPSAKRLQLPEGQGSMTLTDRIQSAINFHNALAIKRYEESLNELNEPNTPTISRAA
jgi:curved DNA-binding protein CbpA